MSGPVTRRPKRYDYAFECVGCGLLNVTDRRDRMTCSNACRVRAHRSGELRRQRAMAGKRYPVWMLPQMAALLVLCPHLEPRIVSGEVVLDDVRGEIWAAFWKRLRPDAEGTA